MTDETVTEIAGRRSFYAVFRDSGMADDSGMTNFDRIFETYSPRPSGGCCDGGGNVCFPKTFHSVERKKARRENFHL